MIKTTYVSKGNILVSPHFHLKELQCKDGTDMVKYCPETLELVEKLRALTKCSGVIVTSGYRTPSHNIKIGGASSSVHVEGYAMDCHFMNSKYNTKEICCMAQDLGFRGIGYINENAVHLDMKNRTYRGDERINYNSNVGGDFYKYFGIPRNLPTSIKEPPATPAAQPKSTQQVKVNKPTIRKSNASKYKNEVKEIQTILRNKGYVNVSFGKLTNKLISTDGIWGNNTEQAIRRFQKNNGLVVDGIVGVNTWKKLLNK